MTYLIMIYYMFSGLFHDSQHLSFFNPYVSCGIEQLSKITLKINLKISKSERITKILDHFNIQQVCFRIF